MGDFFGDVAPRRRSRESSPDRVARTGKLTTMKERMSDLHEPKPVPVHVPVMGRPPRPEEMPRPLMMVEQLRHDHQPLMKVHPAAFAAGWLHREVTRMLWCIAFVLAVVVLVERLAAG